MSRVAPPEPLTFALRPGDLNRLPAAFEFRHPDAARLERLLTQTTSAGEADDDA